jgi:hypothetical protein
MMINYIMRLMFEYLLKLLTPRGANGEILPIIGYFLQNNRKKLAFVKSFAIQSEVFGLEVVVGETSRCKQTNGGNQHLDQFVTKVYLTQHSSSLSTIDEAIDILYNCDEFYDHEVYWVEIPNNIASMRRAVITLNHRCQCPSFT